jgi:hypothetical protein
MNEYDDDKQKMLEFYYNDCVTPKIGEEYEFAEDFFRIKVRVEDMKETKKRIDLDLLCLEDCELFKAGETFHVWEDQDFRGLCWKLWPLID